MSHIAGLDEEIALLDEKITAQMILLRQELAKLCEMQQTRQFKQDIRNKLFDQLAGLRSPINDVDLYAD